MTGIINNNLSHTLNCQPLRSQGDFKQNKNNVGYQPLKTSFMGNNYASDKFVKNTSN